MSVPDQTKENNLTDDELERYKRHISLNKIGIEGQRRLKNSSVICVGAGGIGSSALIYLAAAGIGTIGIIDDDNVEESNLQRQIIHDNYSIGENKVTSANKRIKELNPFCKIITYKNRLTIKNIFEIISKYDIVCDCSDNFGTRFLINDACIIQNKPFIFGAVQGFEGQVSVFNLRINSPNLRDLIPRNPHNKNIPSCKEFGVVGVATGLVGVIQASEIVKIIIKKGNILDGKLLIIDLLTMNIKKLNLESKSCNQDIKNLVEFKKDYENITCKIKNPSVKEVSTNEFNELYKDNQKDILIIDVREEDDFQTFSIEGSISIPLGSLDQAESIKFIKDNCYKKQIYTICKKGLRSLRASEILMNHKIEAISIAGGIDQLKYNL